MQITTTIIYAFRNRDLDRVNLSLQSLGNQLQPNFEVVFVDYGSDSENINGLKKLVESFNFARFYNIAHPGLLWNKSKALNYAIKKVKTDYVFVADIDIVFHPKTTTLFNEIAEPGKAILFKLCYIPQEFSKKINEHTPFDDIPIKHCGDINGMVLVSKSSLVKIHGFDEFFHFYGSEDVDLFQRLQHAGLEVINNNATYFKHIWHQIYNSYNDAILSETPRLFNVKRINLQHYLLNRKLKNTVPIKQDKWGEVIENVAQECLQKPNLQINLSNIHEHVLHFFNVELKSYNNKVVKVVITKSNKNSFKYHLKKALGKKVINYLSMKEVNDLILSTIIYNYLHFNYSYKISSDFNTLEFTIKL